MPCPEPLPVVNVVTCVVYYSSPDPETPDARIPVEQLPRSVTAVVQHYNGRQHCSTDSSINIPLPPDQHHISDVARWR